MKNTYNGLKTLLLPIPLSLSLACAPAHAGEAYGPPSPEAQAPVPARSPSSDEIKAKRWERVLPLEIAWQVLHGIDAYQTYRCNHVVKGCYEAGGAEVILGKHPSKREIVGWWAGFAVVHYLVAREASEISPVAGFVFEGVTIYPKAKTVRANFRIGL